jgi:ribosomal protein L37AE/L43A
MKHICPSCGSNMWVHIRAGVEYWLCESGHPVERFPGSTPSALANNESGVISRLNVAVR